MTNNRDYIYVLANSAMPDLVKVGKTTRTPAERAAELSKVTGVPTPFIVVYEQLVDDCTAAEEFVHTMLQQKGYRESDNREFFRAPVSEVIQIIIKMPAQFSSNSDVQDDEDAEFFSNEPNDELDEFVLDDDEDEEPDYPG
ncbi:MAG: GIY-YIG nuclease family protein [Methylococcaceae bacterium]|nr:GIY-YIG nuclease family protein [Methylococcaceae bacterium]